MGTGRRADDGATCSRTATEEKLDDDGENDAECDEGYEEW